MFRRSLLPLVGVLGILLQSIGTGAAQDGRGHRSGSLNSSGYRNSYPWNAPGYQGYRERVVYVPVYVQPGEPQRYNLQVSGMPEQGMEDPNAVTLIAHVPEHARVFVDGNPTASTGDLRTFYSPALAPGNYAYSVRVDWLEDEKWVGQTHTVRVQPGGIYCVYLMKQGASLEPTPAVAASLSKLGAEDRKLAEAQRFCAVQNGVPLGAMGTPLKIMLKGTPVFLCCEACKGRAEKDANQTITRAKELKVKHAPSTAK
jgi:uncharacterized protein (TIGR03000 family)